MVPGLVSICICFPPTSKVRTSRGSVPISELDISDRVATVVRNPDGQIKHKETSFLNYIHFDPDLQGEYLQVKCDNNSELLVSEDHLIFKVPPSTETAITNAKWECVRAKNLQLEDTLVHVGDQERITSYPRIVSIDKKVVKGVYAPLTMNGTLLVDNLLVSCYAYINSHEIAHAAYAPLRFWSGMVLPKKFKEISTTTNTPSITLSESSEEERKMDRNKKFNGIHKYALALIALNEFLPRKLTPN